MNDQDWRQLHQRDALGEELSAEERAVYEVGLKRLDEDESYPGQLILLRQMRAQTAALEAEQDELKARHDALKAEIAAVEATLDEPTRKALGLATASGSG